MKLSLAVLATFVLCSCSRMTAPPAATWRSDWAVADGLALALDAGGFQFPTAIAFVPRPGSEPNDPLYFVAELYGAIKVVSNDRSIHLFARDLGQVSREADPPDVRGELGLAGLCLDPDRGYVFATFVGYDETGVLRNYLMRFETRPQTFAIAPRSQTLIDAPFAGHETSFNHSIGPCAVDGDALYVGVGDAFDPALASSSASVAGKVLRMSVDGLPLADNPHAVDDAPGRAANYVWAGGFRNPYSLAVVNGQVFVADNGETVDRFLALQPGATYLWDGNGSSFATNAGYLFLDPVAPTQMAAVDRPSPLLPPGFGAGFVMGTAVYGHVPGPGLIFLPYDFANGTVRARHRQIVEYTGNEQQRLVAAAVGPDGIYFAPFIGDPDQGSPILKLTYNPAHPHGQTITQSLDGAALLVQKGCGHCHTIGEHVAAGPSLNSEDLLASLQGRLDGPGYAALTAELDDRDDEPFRSYRSARREVLAARGDVRLRVWLTYHLLEPRFDNPDARMPNPGLTVAEAQTLARYLTPERTIATIVYHALHGFMPGLRYHPGAIYFAAGFAFASVLAMLALIGARLVHRRLGKQRLRS